MRSMKRFCSFSDAIDPMGRGKADAKLLDGLEVGGQVLAVWAQEYLTARFFVAEEGDRVVRGLFEVAEADDVFRMS